MYKRFIKSFDLLFDVSPVFNPAYTQTSVAKRNLDQIREAQDLARKKQLDEYFKNLRNKIQ